MKKLIFIFLMLLAPNAWAVNYCLEPLTAGGWKLDETSGNYTDCTANGNTGTVSGTINQSDTLKFGSAAGFTSVNNTSIDFGSGATLDNVFDSGGTLALWLGLDGAGTAANRCTGAQIASKDGASDGWGLCVMATGAVRFSYKFAGGFVDWTSSETPFSTFDGTATHVMVYFNNSSDTNDPTVKIGCSNLTMTESAAPFSTRNTDAALNLLVGLTGVSDGELNGTIDELIFYNGDLGSVCSAISTDGIDGTQGSGGSQSITSGNLINGAVINGITIN